jgi:hypothetical protein
MGGRGSGGGGGGGGRGGTVGRWCGMVGEGRREEGREGGGGQKTRTTRGLRCDRSLASALAGGDLIGPSELWGGPRGRRNRVIRGAGRPPCDRRDRGGGG